MSDPNNNFGYSDSDLLRRRETLKERMAGTGNGNQLSVLPSHNGVQGNEDQGTSTARTSRFEPRTRIVNKESGTHKLIPEKLPSLSPNGGDGNVQSSVQSGGPVIPVSYLDVPAQRRALFTLILALQVLKYFFLLSDHIDFANVPTHLTLSTLWLFTKYLVTDFYTMLAIYLLRIPRLRPKDSEFWLLASSLICCDLFFVFVLPQIWMLFGSLLSMMPLLPNQMAQGPSQPRIVPSQRKMEIGLGSRKPINFDKLIHDSHLGGSYTVKILPDSMVKVNQNKTLYCIHTDTTSKGINIPIFINGTNPTKLTYTFIPVNRKKPKQVTLKLKEFFKQHLVDSDSNLAYGTYQLEAANPGTYADIEVHDNGDLLYQHFEANSIDVAPCPNAVLLTTESTVDACLHGEEEVVEVPVKVTGVPPLRLLYAYKYGNTLNEFEQIITNPDTNQADDEDKSCLTVIERTLPIKVGLHDLGGYNLHLVSVQDQLGNEHTHKKVPSNQVAYNLHPLPSADFKCTTESYKLSPRITSAKLPVQIDGQPDFEVNIRHCPQGDKDIHSNHCEVILQNSTQRLIHYAATKPGAYSVVSIKDKFCSRNVTESTSCLVEMAPKPTMKVDFQPYFGNCNRVVGLDVHLDLTGTPPFKVKLTTHSKTSRRKPVISKTLFIDSNHHIHPIRPEESGDYIYELTNLDSHSYGEVVLNERYQQSIEALPNAKFVLGTRTVRTCVHQEVDPKHYEVQLIGSSPFTLNYSSVHHDSVAHHTVNVADHTETLDLPTQFDAPGRYSFQLSKVVDRSSCENLLENQVLDVVVRTKVPEIRFECGSLQNNFTIHTVAQKAIHLPFHLVGEPPFTLTYTTPDGIQHQQELHNSSSELLGHQQGAYTLDSLTDSSCTGKINPEKSYCNVAFFTQPQLDFAPNQFVSESSNTYVKKSVCLHAKSLVNLEFSGRPPFKLEFQSADPNKLTTERHLQYHDASVHLSLDTSAPGEHRYVLKSYGDQRYPQLVVHPRKVIVQEVYPTPQLEFLDRTPIQLCSTNLQFQVKLKFSGTSNYQAVLGLFDGERKLTQFDVQTGLGADKDQHPLTLDGLNLPTGTYQLRVVEVTDNHGCHAFVQGPHTELDLQVFAPPTLTSHAILKRDLCLGDRIQFNLEGVAPFFVKYQFGGKVYKIQDQGNRFLGMADVQGNFQVDKVCHLGKTLQCCTRPEMNLQVHPLPKATLGDGKQKEVVIRGGQDATLEIKLEGVPPFAFTYIRTELYSTQVLETKFVKEIWDFNYLIKTRLPGVYKVTEIQDAHCAYPPKPNWV